MNKETEDFSNICRQRHGKIKKCFMTGKICVSAEIIENRIQALQNKGESKIEGFMIMPYQPNLNAFFNWSLIRFFEKQYGTSSVTLKRADQIRRTGYVICEKICRKIQEAAFVVVDLSVNNSNVFYEMGLAYGLQHKMITIYNSSSDASKWLKNILPEDIITKTYKYDNLKPISMEENFSQKIYVAPEAIYTNNPNTPNTKEHRIILLDLSDKTLINQQNDDNLKDISLGFVDLIKGAIGVSVDNIVSGLEELPLEQQFPKDYIEIIKNMKTAEEIGEIGKHHENNFYYIKNFIDRAFCVIIRTSNTHPFSYFWLGYCHAIGKNVIPTYEIIKENDKIDDLAFDIRSLWHLVLIKDEPTKILKELEDILKQMIIVDFEEWSRKWFWTTMFGNSGRVSIFAGALHIEKFDREMVGDWDLRIASELMSYFSTHQLLATIESPIYQPPIKKKSDLTNYYKQIEDLIKGKNTIVIASPDVNPLTEVLLGRLYGIDDQKLFKDKFDPKLNSSSVAAVKKRKSGTKESSLVDKSTITNEILNRFFFIEEEGDDVSKEYRGFRGNWLKNEKEGRYFEFLEEYKSQTECKDSDFSLYAHLVIALNPFNTNGQRNFVIILNGISGPSTFALTHLLTGGIGKEFVDYKAYDFNPHKTSEQILMFINEKIKNNLNNDNSEFWGIQMIIRVTVGPPIICEENTTEIKKAIDDGYLTFDTRRVKKWETIGPIEFIKRV